jgi:DNA polymerase III subunit alpha
MTVEMDNTDKLSVLHADALGFGISFEPPNVNTGRYRFEPISNTCVRYGLGAIKGSGEQAIETIVAAREEGGPFTSLFDFCVRVDKGRVNKRTVEALIKAGAFDTLTPHRASLMASVEVAFDFAAATAANANQGGLFDMFDDGDSHGSSTQEPDLASCPQWGVREQLTYEKTAIGFYLSGHLFDEVEHEVRRFARTRLADVADSRDPQWLAGIVTDVRTINGQRGKVVLFRLDDKTGTMEVSMDDALFQPHRDTLKDDELAILHGVVQNDRFSGGLRFKVQQVWTLAAARCRFAKYLRITVPGTELALGQLVAAYPPQREMTEHGETVRGVRVRVRLERPTARCELELDERSLFFPSDAALASWSALASPHSAELVYA